MFEVINLREILSQKQNEIDTLTNTNLKYFISIQELEGETFTVDKAL